MQDIGVGVSELFWTVSLEAGALVGVKEKLLTWHHIWLLGAQQG